MVYSHNKANGHYREIAWLSFQKEVLSLLWNWPLVEVLPYEHGCFSICLSNESERDKIFSMGERERENKISNNFDICVPLTELYKAT